MNANEVDNVTKRKLYPVPGTGEWNGKRSANADLADPDFPLRSAWLNSRTSEIAGLQNGKALQKYNGDKRPRRTLEMFFIYTFKTDGRGIITRCKSRSVFPGHRVQPDRDFSTERTFTPTLRQESLNSLLANAVFNERKLFHLDFKQAYISQKVNRDEHPDGIYVTLPKGYDSSGTIYEMKSMVYGHPESGFAWHRRLDTFLTQPKKFLNEIQQCDDKLDPDYGKQVDSQDLKDAKQFVFEQCKQDSCLYKCILRDDRGTVIEELLMGVYIDDICISCIQGPGSQLFDKWVELAGKYCCDISQCEPLDHFLGMKITEIDNGIELDQQEKIEDIYEDYKDYIPVGFRRPSTPMSNARHVDPFQDSPKSLQEQEIMKRFNYRSLLQRLMQVTTSHLCKYALGVLSRNQVSPGLVNILDLLRVMCWMFDNRHTHKIRMVKSDDTSGLIGYSDADWCGDRATSKSHDAGLILWNGMIIHASSKLQSVIARSSCESEFYSLHKTCVNCERIMKILNFLGNDVRQFNAFCDNASAVEISKRKCGTTKNSRSFRMRNDDMLMMIKEGYLNVEHISGTENPSDAMSKAQSLPMFKKCEAFIYPHLAITTPDSGSHMSDIRHYCLILYRICDW